MSDLTIAEIMELALERGKSDELFRKAIWHAAEHYDGRLAERKAFILGALFMKDERTKSGTYVTVRNGEERISFDESTGSIRYPNDH
jgi:transcription initiation factor IIE alpha subunit